MFLAYIRQLHDTFFSEVLVSAFPFELTKSEILNKSKLHNIQTLSEANLYTIIHTKFQHICHYNGEMNNSFSLQ